MNYSRLWGAFSACVLTFGVVVSADAALLSRLGGQAVYDTDLDITWIADANLAASNTFGITPGASLGTHPSDTSGADGIINLDGTMSLPGALFWIDAMNADGGTGYLGFNDWRLPTTLDPDASCTTDAAGTTPSANTVGFNCTGGELGHLFYNELGGIAGSSILTSGDPDLALFTDIQVVYWTGTEGEPVPGFLGVWGILFDGGVQSGFQDAIIAVANLHAWAVRSGDVSAVPVPAAAWLFISGLIGLIGLAKRKC